MIIVPLNGMLHVEFVARGTKTESGLEVEQSKPQQTEIVRLRVLAIDETNEDIKVKPGDIVLSQPLRCQSMVKDDPKIIATQADQSEAMLHWRDVVGVVTEEAVIV